MVFAGRSNVGKSSLINKLCNRKSLAKVSGTPGKTVTINFYKLKDLRMVDLPGYGYAKRAKTRKDDWGDLLEHYFASYRDIRLVLLLVDIRHDPSEDDMIMHRFLFETNHPYTIILTKSDKLSENEMKQAYLKFSEIFMQNIIMVSSTNGNGIDELKTLIENAIKDDGNV